MEVIFELVISLTFTPERHNFVIWLAATRISHKYARQFRREIYPQWYQWVRERLAARSSEVPALLKLTLCGKFVLDCIYGINSTYMITVSRFAYSRKSFATYDWMPDGIMWYEPHNKSYKCIGIGYACTFEFEQNTLTNGKLTITHPDSVINMTAKITHETIPLMCAWNNDDSSPDELERELQYTIDYWREYGFIIEEPEYLHYVIMGMWHDHKC